MNKLRVLVVEDEIVTAMELEATIIEITAATVIIKTSVASTMKVLQETFDFVFLDIEVTNGKTFEVAQILGRKRIPFAFVSGSSPEHLPHELRVVPFIPKPFRRSEIKQALLSAPEPSD
jgi:DNA-binding LytR/AlgR family response regulator